MSKIVPLEGFGGGGTPLNFQIVAYATEEELAAAQPKENTIGVVTTTPINGWIFNTIEPTELIEGIVWISTSTSSTAPFNVLKKNGIMIYPVSAKQYIDNTWTDVIAKSYQNNTWIQFSDNRDYLFKSGEGAVVPLKTYRESKATISVTTDNISTKASSNEYCYVSARTEAKIDLSDYSKMCITYTAAKPEWNGNIIGVTSKAFTKGDAQPSNGVSYAATAEIGQAMNATTAILDISTINDSLYCAFYYCGTMTITEWWLE